MFNARKQALTHETIIELKQKIEVKNAAKKTVGTSPTQNYLVVDVYNGSQLANTMTLAHPLYKNIEYVDDNDKLKMKAVMLDSGEFFIRVNVQGKPNTVKISEVLKDQPARELAIIPL